MKVLLVSVLAAGLVLLPSFTQTKFFVDGKVGFELYNFYLNCGHRQSGISQSYPEERTQGFLLYCESGHTGGLFDLGVDVPGLLGIRLDSSSKRSGSSLSPYLTSDRRATHDYSSLDLTVRLRVSHSTLKISTLMSRLPMVQFNDTRLHPQVFRGGPLEVNETDRLALQFGQLRQVKQRDLTDAEDLGITRDNKRNALAGRYLGSDHFDFAGDIYRWSERLSSSYHYVDSEDFYHQHHLSVQHPLLLANDQSLGLGICWTRSTGEGGSRVDNRALNALLACRLGSHAFDPGYQCIPGGDGFIYLAETDLYLINFVQTGNFVSKDERPQRLRYDYDFATAGLPRLTFMSRYLRGEHIDLLDGGGCGKEWERDTGIAYLAQSGPLKDLGIKLRNDTFRSDFGNGIDETWLIISYVPSL